MSRSEIGDRKVLDRRVPSSNKYPQAKSTVDTGTNVLNTRAAHSGPRPEEHFKRMRVSTLHRLLSSPPEDRDRDVLLVDIRGATERDRDEYETAHIDGALHYPPAMLSRAMNPLLPEMFAYKNKDGRAICAYDLEDTRDGAARVAGLLFEKGVDNIFVLTGGLLEMVREHPEHIVGDPPQPPAADRRPTRRAGGMGGSLAPSDAASCISRSGAVSNASSHKPKPLSSSLSKTTASPSWR